MPTSIYLQRTNHTTTFNTSRKKHPQTTWGTTNTSVSVPEDAVRYHTHAVGTDQCTSSVVQLIAAPVEAVWSLIRPFDKPDTYKKFLKSCQILHGSGEVGTVREVQVVSGLPASSSTERLEILDDERRVMSFSVIGGLHRLQNYRSITSLHRRSCSETLVVESYVVDVPQGNTKEETCSFVDTIIGCNLQSLAQVSEKSMMLR